VKVKLKMNGQVVDGESVPFATESEHFNVYTPNVPEGHPLFGVTIKARLVVKQINFTGLDELGNPQIAITADTVLGME
jgi:hypothetical protein